MANTKYDFHVRGTVKFESKNVQKLLTYGTTESAWF